MDFKNDLKDKGARFYAVLVTMLLSLVAAIVYACIYGNTRFMSWVGFGLMIAGAILAGVLVAFKLEKYAPTLLLVMNFVGFLFYVYYIYFHISVVMVGIQASGFPPEFFVNVVFLVLALASSVASIFMPLKKGSEQSAYASAQ